ncbi:MAG: adenylate kinase [Oscillospiraceae bacterium]|jgi:adenylate kinase|nr:adenylate kinase [Oscillospiraceae bacterium]
MNVVFLGPPGSGKGTHAHKASQQLGIPRLSTGDMLRENIKQGTKLGQEAKAYIEAGQLVPDALVIAMLSERLAQPDCQNGAIFDGFPRTEPQAEALDQIATIDRVLNLAIADEAIVNRMKGRRVCPACGFTSHTSWLGDKTDCPQCGKGLTIRSDDAPETVLARLSVYHAQTKPLISYYEQRGLLNTIDSDGEVEAVTARVLEALA